VRARFEIRTGRQLAHIVRRCLTCCREAAAPAREAAAP